jgi:TRAP-type C4-dicarboxylate transport system substrate-binding protein
MRQKSQRVSIVYFAILLIFTAQILSINALAEEKATIESVAPVTLRWTERESPRGIRSKIMLWMGKEIEKRTNGRIKIQIDWKSTATTGQEILQTTMTGASDMGTIDVGDYPSQLPTWGVFNTFMIGPSTAVVVSKIERTCFETIPAFNAELQRWNQRWITFFNYLPSAISLNKPIDSIEDLTGQRIMAFSSWQRLMLNAIDVSAVSVADGAFYATLNRGAIDGALTSLDRHFNNYTNEIANNYLFSKKHWQPQPILVTVNLEVWNRILEEDRNKILAIGKRASQLQNKLNSDYWDLCKNEIKMRANAVFTQMSEEELNAWANLPNVEALPRQWVTEASSAGFPADEILNQVKENIKKGLAEDVK